MPLKEDVWPSSTDGVPAEPVGARRTPLPSPGTDRALLPRRPQRDQGQARTAGAVTLSETLRDPNPLPCPAAVLIKTLNSGLQFTLCRRSAHLGSAQRCCGRRRQKQPPEPKMGQERKRPPGKLVARNGSPQCRLRGSSPAAGGQAHTGASPLPTALPLPRCRAAAPASPPPAPALSFQQSHQSCAVKSFPVAPAEHSVHSALL